MALDVMGSLTVAALVILLGRGLHRLWPALTRWHIPEPVSGGTAWALGVALLHAMGGPSPEISAAIREPMLLAFFATVGLSADLRALIRGGVLLLRFALLTVVLILGQNALGVGLALAMGLDPLIGLLAGSVTLVGGHGTGAAFGALFARDYGLAAALELALAAKAAQAQGQWDASPLGPGFLKGKLAATDYFFAYELPKIDAWLGVVSRRDLTCAQAEADWF